MENQLTEQEIQNAFAFLNRADIKGGESEAMTALKYKLNQILAELKAPAPELAPVPAPEPDITEPLPQIAKGKKEA